MSNNNTDDQAFLDDFGAQIPCWLLRVGPYICFFCIFWTIGRLSSRRDTQVAVPWRTGRRSRKDAMNQGFSKAVVSVAKHVKSTGKGDSSAVNRVHPMSGKYKCIMQYQNIIDRHDSSSFFEPRDPVAYIMNLKVAQLSSDGFSLTGHRTDMDGNLWEIEESLVNKQGETYWVERYADARILSHGKFINSKVFDGEWMNSDGFRGKYSEFILAPQEQRLEVHIGVPLQQTETRSLISRISQKFWPFRAKAIETAVPLPSQTV